MNSPELPMLTSALLSEAGFSHGFFTRRGGVSDGVFDSLNFTAATGDSEANVEQNLKLAATRLGVQAQQVYFLSQVHGTHSFEVSGNEDRQEVLKTEGDIVLTREPGVAAAIRTADCVPVLLACPETGWAAACHSGWQGCVKKAAMVSAELLRKRGATRLLAAIGPHISLQSFEVSDDVALELVSASPDPDIVDRSGKKPHVDLRKMVRSQLEAAGVAEIDDVLGCTVIEKQNYFSYRRDGNPSGRLLSAIVGRGAR